MIAVNGLGRIGRLVVRRLTEARPGALCAVNDPADLVTVLHLLRRDSVHGTWPGAPSGLTEHGQDYLVFPDGRIPLFHERDPARLPFGACGAQLVVESSGRFTAREDAAKHLKDGVARVVISAPSPDADLTLIAPVNGGQFAPAHHTVLSNASCTAHATAPMLQVLDEAFGLEAAGMSTVHVVTNDQRLQDLPHHDRRRARAAFQSIIPTTSSAFEALRRAMPGLPTGFSGSALRVPTLSVNLVDLTATLGQDVTAEQVNAAYRTAAASSHWQGILALAPDHAVSRDFTGRPESVLMDLELTRVLGGRFVKVFGWHDNETGYAARLTELVLTLAR